MHLRQLRAVPAACFLRLAQFCSDGSYVRRQEPGILAVPLELVASGTQRGGIPAATDNYLREVQRHAPPSERENSAQLLAPSSGKLADGVGPSFIRAELLAAQNGGTSRRSKRQRQDTCHSGWFHTTEVRHSA